MITLRLFPVLPVLALGFSLAGDAEAKFSRTGGASVAFTAIGPAGLKIVGTTSELSVKDSDSELKIVVPLKNLDTKIDLRNKHMREKYLETDKFPDAVLSVSRSELKIPASGEASAEAGGTMQIHGQSRPVRVRYTAKRDGSVIAVSSSTHINMKDFGIEQPSFMGATVRPEVNVTANFSVKDE